jgi:hypothetical protein
MKILSVSAGSYTNALVIAKALESLGVGVTIPACGLIIRCKPEQSKEVLNICKLFNATIEIITEV